MKCLSSRVPARSWQFSPRGSVCWRCLHTTPVRDATAHPVTMAGPVPAAPQPAPSQYGERIDRRRRQAEMLKRGQELRDSQAKPTKKRFWKDVSIQRAPEGHFTVHLDHRPVRHPTTKGVLPIPASKPHLASAIALEWDLLTSVQQASKTHLIPITSLTSRAHDIQLADSNSASNKTRQDIVNMLMRYLDTDTLLCWAPSNNSHDALPTQERKGRKPQSLRERQIAAAQPIIAWLSTRIWPGVEITPVLDDGAIMPASQSEGTNAVVRGWLTGLGPYELAGLERAVLASKSLCIGVRLLCEWSEEFPGARESDGGGRAERFGVEEAAQASSIEVSWQTGMWGEVEDTHDVDKEDLRRQFGSVVLLVSGHPR